MAGLGQGAVPTCGHVIARYEYLLSFAVRERNLNGTQKYLDTIGVFLFCIAKHPATDRREGSTEVLCVVVARVREGWTYISFAAILHSNI